MSNPTHRKPGSKRHPFEMMRSKAALATVAGVVVLGFIGALIAFSDPMGNDEDPTATPTENAEPTPSGPPKLDPQVAAALRGRSTCTKVQEGELIAGFDDIALAEIVEGEPEVRSVARKDGAAAIELVNGQNTSEGVVRVELGETVDLSGTRLGLWIRQSGGLVSPPSVWRVRLITEAPDSSFERIFRSSTVREAATNWCFDLSAIREWTRSGNPDASAVTAVELLVPAYVGAGAGSTVAFDDLVAIT